MNADKYNDIIGLSHHVSKKRARLSMEARAAQFSSFQALRGHKEGVDETADIHEINVESREDTTDVDTYFNI